MSLTQPALLTERKEPRLLPLLTRSMSNQGQRVSETRETAADALVSVSLPVKSSQLKPDMSLGLKNDYKGVMYGVLESPCLNVYLHRHSKIMHLEKNGCHKILGYTFSYCNLLFCCTQ